MKKRNLLIFALLIMGLLFSTTFGFKFNLPQGFDFKGFWISLPLQLFDFAVTASNELSLTSQFIGYLIYLIFGILCLERLDLSIKTNLITVIIFFALIGIVFLSDFYSFYQDLNNKFTGRHFRIGLTVFLLGLAIYYRLLTDKVNTEKKE